jgi:hypothetical protein
MQQLLALIRLLDAEIIELLDEPRLVSRGLMRSLALLFAIAAVSYDSAASGQCFLL